MESTSRSGSGGKQRALLVSCRAARISASVPPARLNFPAFDNSELWRVPSGNGSPSSIAGLCSALWLRTRRTTLGGAGEGFTVGNSRPSHSYERPDTWFDGGKTT